MVNFVYEKWMERSSLLNFSRTKVVKEGIKAAHAKRATQQRVRWLLSWGMLRGM